MRQLPEMPKAEDFFDDGVFEENGFLAAIKAWENVCLALIAADKCCTCEPVRLGSS